MSVPDPTDPVAFAERVLALLDHGRYTTSYKYATLLALVDCCVEAVAADGAPPRVLHARDVAGKVLALYWRQAVPFHGGGEPALLDQRIELGKRDLVSYIAAFRAAVGRDLGLEQARRADPAGFAELRSRAEGRVIAMPLPKLQRVNPEDPFGDGFLYRIGWPDQVSESRVRRPDFDDRIHLKEGVGELLVRLAGLVRPLVQRKWAAFVARRNAQVLDEQDLDGFLFGAERVALGRVRDPLADLQQRNCFYCTERLHGHVEIDHFLPWSRCADDGLDNLVAAHASCNNRKRASLAATGHVARWLDRSRRHDAALRSLAEDARWSRDWPRTLGNARALYLYQAASLPLWQAQTRYVPADHDALRALLTTGARSRAAEDRSPYDPAPGDPDRP